MNSSVMNHEVMQKYFFLQKEFNFLALSKLKPKNPRIISSFYYVELNPIPTHNHCALSERGVRRGVNPCPTHNHCAVCEREVRRGVYRVACKYNMQFVKGWSEGELIGLPVNITCSL